ncbi:hypothetical protein LCGC14_0709870 [marine sediment metagenome]|uniref:Uncharacterized protein n=1 Tax=marine sediment metagenome TaxID=412755 RepID=A0A0F9R0W7_9ZZZZ
MRGQVLARKLIARFKAAGHPWPYGDDAVVVRTYAGRHQLAAGAFRWHLARRSKVGIVQGIEYGKYGSSERAGEVARAATVTVDTCMGDVDLVIERS